jgi:CHAT domain-containing protein
LDKEILVFLVRPDRAELVRTECELATLKLLIKRLRLATEFPPTGGLPPFPHALAHELYRILLGPVGDHLLGVKHLILVPEGPLQSLSFAMLETGEVRGTPSTKNVPWVARRYALSTLPGVASLRALRRHTKEKTAPEPFVGFGDPALKGDDSENSRSVKMGNFFSRGRVADTRAVSGLHPLPETAGELREIANALKAPHGSLYLREAATETRVKTMPLDRYHTIAFATHGLMAGEFNGLAEPALVLSPPVTGTAIDDGLLTASEVTGLKLAADWVILSACNTAAPDGTPGASGFSGLTKAFFYAGAKTLLVSHWAVESKSAASITTRLFREVKKGTFKAEALRHAMMTLAGSTETSHPAYWAPFVVVGEGKP